LGERKVVEKRKKKNQANRCRTFSTKGTLKASAAELLLILGLG
jgi:hypothetical protein